MIFIVTKQHFNTIDEKNITPYSEFCNLFVYLPIEGVVFN